MGTWVASMSWLLWIVLLWITGCIYLFELEFSSFPDIYPGVGLLDLTVALFLVFKAISILFFIVAEAIYIPINSVGGVPFLYILINTWAPWVTQLVKNLHAMWETWIGSLGWEDPMEKGMATHSSILAWRIPWTEKLGRLQSVGSQRIIHDWMTFPFINTCYLLSFLKF